MATYHTIELTRGGLDAIMNACIVAAGFALMQGDTNRSTYLKHIHKLIQDQREREGTVK